MKSKYKPFVYRQRLLTFITILFFALLYSPTLSNALSPTQAFNQAKNTYRFGDYKKAAKLLHKLLYPKPGQLRSKYLRNEAQKILGISYYYLYGKVGEEITALQSKGQSVPKKLKKKRKEYLRRSRFELLNYLSENENAQLSALTFQPDLVSFFNQLRRINKKRIARAKRGTKKRNIRETKIIYAQTNYHTYHMPLPLALLPCGVPQFYNGHTAKAIVITTSCSIALTTYLSTYGWMYSLQNARGLFPQEKLPLVRKIQIVHIASLVTLGAVMLYGYIDGFIYFQTKRQSVIPILPKLSPSQIGTITVHTDKQLFAPDFLLRFK